MDSCMNGWFRGTQTCRRLGVVAVVGACVVLAGSARGEADASGVKNGPIAIIDQAGRSVFGEPYGIATIDAGGALHPLFRCRLANGCYFLESVDWAPDGQRLAFSVTTVSSVRSYSGIHIYNVRSRSDRHLARDGFDLDWSPDGSRLAYVAYALFSRPVGSIYLLRPNGKETPLRTGTEGRDSSPSWSPDGRHLVYETQVTNVAGGSSKFADQAILTIAANGSTPRLLATSAADPAWSPDGRTIAYDSECGIRLVTPTGRDVTPVRHTNRKCRGLGVQGKPIWSPDGRKIAIGNKHGVYVINKDGSHFHKLTPANPTGMFGISRPTWQPTTR